MIGLIADTHENIPNIKNAVAVFKKKRVNLVLHLGDVIAPVTVVFFRGIPIKFIKGNCDGDVEGIKRKCAEIGAEYLGEQAVMDLKGKKCVLYHGTNKEKLIELIASGQYDYVLHGHDHKMRNEKVGKTRVINPGAHYYKCENTIALLDIEKDHVEFVEVKG